MRCGALMVPVVINTDAWGLIRMQSYEFIGGNRNSSVGDANPTVDIDGAPYFLNDRVEVSGGRHNETPFAPDYSKQWQLEFDFNFSRNTGRDKTVYRARDSSLGATVNGMLWDCDGFELDPGGQKAESNDRAAHSADAIVFMGVHHPLGWEHGHIQGAWGGLDQGGYGSTSDHSVEDIIDDETDPVSCQTSGVECSSFPSSSSSRHR